MTYDTVCEQCGRVGEISKAMAAALPACPRCGGTLKRLYRTPPAVQYHAPGFASHDTRFRQMVGAECFARFEAQKADAERRAQAGRLTPYEKELEQI